MREFSEIRKKVKYVLPLFGETYKSEIEVGHIRGTVIFGFNENGWEHVSVSPYGGRTPSWDDMCKVKDIFWNDEEVVIQIHPKKSEYVNIQENCLHLWRHKEMELPK